MEAFFNEQAGYFNIESNLKVNKPEFKISVDREKAALLGIEPRQIAQTLQAFYGGVQAGNFTLDGRRYEVRVQLPSEARRSPGEFPASSASE